MKKMKNFTKEELQAICGKFIGTPVNVWGRDVADEIRDEIRKITGDNNFSCYMTDRRTLQLKLSYHKRIDDYNSQDVIICYITCKKQKAKTYRRWTEPQWDYKSFEIGNVTPDIEAKLNEKEEARLKKIIADNLLRQRALDVLKMVCKEYNVDRFRAQEICHKAYMVCLSEEEEKYVED